MVANVKAQCPTIICPSDIVVNNDAGSCDAIVNYSAPVGTNPCPDTTVTFSFTGTIDTWTVPTGVTSVRIEAKGAEGGTDPSSSVVGGLGAIMIGDFNVTPGATLKILVGEKPARNGGGGGTFVTDNSNNPLIVAGGGGGSGAANDSPNKNANITTTGGTGSGGGGLGGSAGNGGAIGATFASGAGGGLLTDGADGWTANSGGDAFVNGGAGANVGFGIGGFGGGGNGSGNAVGGGGGGYSGGGAASNSLGSGGVGGGGASFNGGTNQNNTGGVNLGNGEVLISWGVTPVSTTQIAGLASGSNFPIGITTNTFVVTAGSVTDTCSFTVTVNDTEVPTISCPSNVISCVPVVNNIAPVAADNCSGETVAYILTGATTGSGASDASGTTFNQGITTVKYIVTDASGNKDSCSFNVEVLAPLTGSVTNTICNNDSVVINGTTYNASNPSGTEVFTNVGPNNCDSTVTINLTVLPALTGTINQTICFGDSIVVNGTTYNTTVSGATEVFTNIGPNGCDSTVTINLTVSPAIDNTTTVSGNTITANETGATYQWLDCDNGNAVINGETSQSFTATVTGNYAVEITVGNCIDTSACENITVVGIDELSKASVTIYPNPNDGVFNVVTSEQVNITIYNMLGEIILTNVLNGGTHVLSLNSHPKGVYFVNIQQNESVTTYKMIVK
jgi:hypothetical protein